MESTYTGKYKNIPIPYELLIQAHLDSVPLSFEVCGERLVITQQIEPNQSDSKPHKNWPKGTFTPYHDDSFPGIAELRAELIEPKPVDL